MCGIFGAIGKANPNTLRVLAAYNEDRGAQSYGILTENHVMRDTKGISNALRDDIWEEQTNYVLGHTRYATHGKVTKENAHPFTYGCVTGAHNGVIDNHEEIAKREGISVNVDSEVVFHLLDYFDPAKLADLSGYWGLWWIDTREPDAVFLATHNVGSILSIARTKKAVYFSSDVRDLQDAGLKATVVPNNVLLRVNTKTLAIVQKPMDWPARTMGTKRWEDYHLGFEEWEECEDGVWRWVDPKDKQAHAAEAKKLDEYLDSRDWEKGADGIYRKKPENDGVLVSKPSPLHWSEREMMNGLEQAIKAGNEVNERYWYDQMYGEGMYDRSVLETMYKVEEQRSKLHAVPDQKGDMLDRWQELAKDKGKVAGRRAESIVN